MFSQNELGDCEGNPADQHNIIGESDRCIVGLPKSKRIRCCPADLLFLDSFSFEFSPIFNGFLNISPSLAGQHEIFVECDRPMLGLPESERIMLFRAGLG